MRFVVVTGMSGGGKSTAMRMLEDMGFYCVDNLPIPLIDNFAELMLNEKNENQDIALGVDIRSGEDLSLLGTIIEKWEASAYPFSILFLESSDEVLIKRYKETRRSHPLSKTGRIEKGIQEEREKLAFLRSKAVFIASNEPKPSARAFSNSLPRSAKELSKIALRELAHASAFDNIVS